MSGLLRFSVASILVLLLIIIYRELEFKSSNDSSPMIVFVSDQEGNLEIYGIDVSGSNMRNLTNNSAKDFFPAWSPDGKYIAFVSDRDNKNGDIFVMNADGSNVRNLTNNEAIDQGVLKWSPDGKYIAFVSDRDNKNGDIFVVDLEESRIFNLIDDSYANLFPDWSVDGKEIAFVSNKNGSYDIFTINVETLETQTVFATGEDVWFPSFSPNGDYLAFTSISDGTLMGLNTNDYHMELRNTKSVSLPPISWSSDGAWFAVSSTDPGDSDVDITLVRTTNFELRTLPHKVFDDWSPVWSPNGDYIATISSRNGVGDVFIFSLDDGEIRKITANALRFNSETPPELLFGQIVWQPISTTR